MITIKENTTYGTEVQVVMGHLELINVKFKQHPTKSNTLLFQTGILVISNLEGKPTYEFNGVRIKFEMIKDLVT